MPEQKATNLLGICRICGKPARATPWKSLECGNCGSVTADILPTNAELAEFYSNYNDNYSGGGNSGGRNQIRYARKYLSLVTSGTVSGTLIDIGCANNPFPNFAAEAGFSVTAADFSKPEGLHEKVTFDHGHLNDPRMLEGEALYDTITAWAVLEHVLDPDLAFAIIRKLSKPNSRIFLTTPEIGTSLTHGSAGRTPWFYPPEHLNLISPKGIEILASRHGLRLDRWGHFEITTPRFLARYGIGLTEAIAGGLLKAFAPGRWSRMRDNRQQKFRGIALYILSPV